MSELTEIQRANARAMRRYRQCVIIEIGRDGVWVTMGGDSYFNDEAKTSEALEMLKAQAVRRGAGVTTACVPKMRPEASHRLPRPASNVVRMR